MNCNVSLMNNHATILLCGQRTVVKGKASSYLAAGGDSGPAQGTNYTQKLKEGAVVAVGSHVATAAMSGCCVVQ